MTDLTQQPAEAPVSEEPQRIDPPASPVETPATETTEATPADIVIDDARDDDEPERKRVPGSQRLKRRLQLVESDYLALQRENEELKRRPQPQNPQGRPGIDREPTEADFPGDYFAFERARTTWDVAQTLERKFTQQREAEQTQAQQRAANEFRTERLEAYEENANTVRERIPDFDKVVQTAANVPVSREVGEELLASPKSALLQYYLAKNPDKVRELNEMSGRELAREIGRLESRVHLPTAKKATEATPPPAELRGGAARPVDPRTGPDDMNAYVAWRKKQGAAF